MGPRRRGLPYQANDEDQCVMVDETIRKDVAARRMLVCAKDSFDERAPTEATPSTTLAMRNPDRTIFHDRRDIEDLRRARLHFPTARCYPPYDHTEEEIARLVLIIRTCFPCTESRFTMRGVASAFRMIRLRPAPSLATAYLAGWPNCIRRMW